MKTQVTYQEKRRVKTTFISRCLVSAILVLVLFMLSIPQTLNALGETIHNKEEPEVATEEVSKSLTQNLIRISHLYLKTRKDT